MRLWRRYVIDPSVRLLKQGLTPRQIALSIAFGVTLGVFPVLGSTILLCAAATFLFRLNPIVIQATNYAVYPLQFLLLIPFYRLGAVLFGTSSRVSTAHAVVQLIEHDKISAIRLLWTTTWHATIAWSLIAPFAAGGVYLTTTSLLNYVQRRYDSKTV